MSEASVLAGVPTPRGKASPRGALHGTPPLRLVTGLLEALAERGVKASSVEDMLLGCATQVDGQGCNLARTATLTAGWGPAGTGVPGATVNRFCASGLDAANLAAARVRAGDAQLVLAGGVESVSTVPMFSDRGPLYADAAVMKATGSVHMGIAADLVATRERFDRGTLDEYALRTRAKARAGWTSGAAATSVVPVRDASGKVVCARDELVDYAPTAAEVAALPPAFAELGADGQDAIVRARHPEMREIHHLHTRASSPPLADAAALVAIGDLVAAGRLALRPRARILATIACADDPVVMLTAGQTAVERLLDRARLRAADVDVYEFAEAFSALCLRFQRDLDVRDDRLNPNGGTLALGHAFGATGAILLLNVVDELERRGGRYGVAAVSGAAGVGVATLVERVA
jgi:acetyl-CoA C-acetyltransferase